MERLSVAIADARAAVEKAEKELELKRLILQALEELDDIQKAGTLIYAERWRQFVAYASRKLPDLADALAAAECEQVSARRLYVRATAFSGSRLLLARARIEALWKERFNLSRALVVHVVEAPAQEHEEIRKAVGF